MSPANGKHFSLEELQGLVGGYIEVLYLKNGTIMVINEDGKNLNLPRNERAMLYVVGLLDSADYIVGDAVIIKGNQLK